MAGGDAQTAEAGARLLREGGNAVDAAVAAAFAAFVCELPLCSPLGGGVMLVEREGNPAVAYDMFARTPGLGLTERPVLDFDAVSVSFGAADQVFHVGRASVAMPLALAGLLQVHARHGALPLAAVLAPAIELGRDGYVVGAGLAFVFAILDPIIHRTPECRALFADADGTVGRVGARCKNGALAAVLEDIARRPERVRDVYAQLARDFGPRDGGLVTAADVANLDAVELAPVTVDHAGWRLATMPSPSTGGLLVALGTRLLEGIGGLPRLSREHVLRMAEVQEALLLQRRVPEFVARCADPAAVRALLADERLAAARFDPRNRLGSTTQISAIDEHGNAVSLTLTNGEGSGHVLAGTGMIANNMMGEEDLHPRGFHVDPPGTPLSTMMAPTLLARGEDRIALGSGGSNRLRTAILQVIVGLVEHGVDPETAVAAPRLHLEMDAAGTPRIAFESDGLAHEVALELAAAYPPKPSVFAAPNLYFGGVHLAVKRGGVFTGVGDARRSGKSVVV